VPDTVRLKNEWKLLRELNESSDLVKVIPTESFGSVPIKYTVEYYCRGLTKNHRRGTVQVYDPTTGGKPHILRLEPTNEYPDVRPVFEMATPIFHPNINDVPPAPKENFERFGPGFICIFRGVWPGPRIFLRDIVLIVGEMIQLKRHGLGRANDLLPTPICREAAKWIEQNKQAIPVDTRPISGRIAISKDMIEFLDEEEGMSVVDIEL
jgi:hypothetical protein